MKADRARIERAVTTPDAASRCVLLYGPDEAGSRQLADRFGEAMGAGAERVDLTGPGLKGDPARLAEEAASISLFGDVRWIRVEPVGDEAADAVEALLATSAAGNPVVLVAGVLRKESRLVKLATAAPAALAFASYVPEGAEADRLVIGMARALGLQLRQETARRLLDAADGDRAVLARELEKYALYLDASPAAPKPLEHDVIDALSAEASEGDLGRLVDAVLGGDAATVDVEVDRLGAGAEPVQALRVLMTRLLLLARVRAAMAAGNGVEAALEQSATGLFWKDKPIVTRQAARWPADALARSIERLAGAERVAKSSAASPAAFREELFAIARHAARLR